MYAVLMSAVERNEADRGLEGSRQLQRARTGDHTFRVQVTKLCSSRVRGSARAGRVGESGFGCRSVTSRRGGAHRKSPATMRSCGVYRVSRSRRLEPAEGG